MNNDILEVDNSTLETLSKCQVAVVMGRILQLKPKEKNYYLMAGTAIHAGWDYWHKTGDADIAIKAVEDSYKDWAAEQPELPEAYTFYNIDRVFRGWLGLQQRPDYTPPFKAELAEVGFRVHLIDNIWATGKLDVWGRDTTTGVRAVADGKTTGRLDSQWKAKWRGSSQVSQYIWASQKIFGEPVWMMYIMGLEIKKLPESTRKCKEHGVQYSECALQHVKTEILTVSRTQGQLDAWWMNAVALAQKYKKLVEYIDGKIERVQYLFQEGMFNNSCYNCPYADFCHLHQRRPEAAEALFKYDPWSPLDGGVVLEEKR